MRALRAVDLFSGCGGMSLGFQKAGFNIVASFDSWPAAVECYKANFRHPIYLADLSDSQSASSTIRELMPDIIIGGPPCQDFSHAGKRTEGARANLTTSYAEIIGLVRPRWFVMENVDRSQASRAYGYARIMFKKAGYGLTECLLNANAYGVPQLRRRFFCIGMMGENDGFLSNAVESAANPVPYTVRDYLGKEFGLEHYYRHPRNYNRRAIFSIDEPAPTVRGVNRPIAKGYTGHSNDTAPLTKSLRSLTTLERARLQTFPKSFKWLGTKTDLEQMIGNAVPVNLAERVARCILNYTIAIERTSFDRRTKNESKRIHEMVGI